MLLQLSQKAVKRIFFVFYARALTSSRMTITRISDKHGNTDAVVLSECGEVTGMSAEAAMQTAGNNSLVA